MLYEVITVQRVVQFGDVQGGDLEQVAHGHQHLACAGVINKPSSYNFV